jgi:hypothetical protein
MKNIDETKLEEAVQLMTGLSCIEVNTSDRYSLKLGTKNPLEVGYDKHRKLLKGDVMRKSALITIIKTLGEMMRDEMQFISWVNENR